MGRSSLELAPVHLTRMVRMLQDLAVLMLMHQGLSKSSKQR
jgi:hypothetical protein